MTPSFEAFKESVRGLAARVSKRANQPGEPVSRAYQYRPLRCGPSSYCQLVNKLGVWTREGR